MNDLESYLCNLIERMTTIASRSRLLYAHNELSQPDELRGELREAADDLRRLLTLDRPSSLLPPSLRIALDHLFDSHIKPICEAVAGQSIDHAVIDLSAEALAMLLDIQRKLRAFGSTLAESEATR